MRYLVQFFCVLILLATTPVFANDVRALAERLEARANSGDERAAYKLGLLFSDGKKVDPDFYTAAEWYELSAKRGYIKGMLKIADFYKEGKGVSVDLEKAAYWNEKAAYGGSVKAMVQLGGLYALKGDFAQSAKWFEKAAVKGDKVSMRELGTYFYKGTGVRFDIEYAFAWLELATQAGDHKARALREKVRSQKGQAWVDGMLAEMENRNIPLSYWNAR